MHLRSNVVVVLMASVFITVAAAILLWFLAAMVVTLRMLVQHRALKISRQPFVRSDPCDLFGDLTCSEAVVRGTVHYLRCQTLVRDLPLLPSDPLSDLFGIGTIGGIDLEEAVEEIAAACHKTIAPTQQWPLVETVGDLARLVNSFPGTP